MKFYLHLAFLVFFLVFGIYLVSERLIGIKASEAGASIKQTNNAEITLRVMTEHCGKCHQSSLPTANPKALEIFDLDKTPWYSTVSDKHLESISKRLSTKSGVSDSERKAILDFIASIRKDSGTAND